MMKKRKTAKKQIRAVINTIAYIGFLLLAIVLVLRFVGQRTTVQGVSMEPALSQGDQILVDKLSYRLEEPERFDIIVFHKGDESFRYIKRIIALPGEQIRITVEGEIFVNGELLEEYYGREAMNYRGLAGMELVLGEDEYFVLGDNRNQSEDSRYETVGMVKRKEIVGRAAFRIFPINAVGSLENQ